LQQAIEVYTILVSPVTQSQAAKDGTSAKAVRTAASARKVIRRREERCAI
jgi:hypothetical protein